MGRDVRFIVMSGDERFLAEVRPLLLQFSGVKIVAEVEEAALLSQAVKQFPVDVALVNLDPSPDAVLPIVGEVAAAHSGVAVFAASRSTDGPLILKAMRLGVQEFLPTPMDKNTLGEAIERVALQQSNHVIQGKLITVMGTSGGVGATMLASNLAVELRDLADGGVTVVDLDYRFGQIATHLDVDPKFTLADLCNTPEQLESQVISRALVRHSSGVHVLSRPANFEQADTMTAASCVGLLSTLLQSNEYVVADGPNRFDLSARSVLDLSDYNLLLLQLLVPGVRNAARVLEGMRDNGCNLQNVHLICNRVGRDCGDLGIDDVSETLGMPMFAAVPNDWSVVSSAINLGEPLLSFSPKSRPRIAIREIAERLHTPASETDDKDTPKKSLIGRIFANG